jgi:predicted nucleic acid-binding protein
MIIDSDILIYFLKGEKTVVQELTKIPSNELCTTRINYTELLYGAYNSSKVEENIMKFKGLLAQFTILEFDERSCEIFAKTKAKLKKEGKIIADMDLMIASIAIANNQVLVSNNQKHFKRIRQLELVDWLA